MYAARARLARGRPRRYPPPTMLGADPQPRPTEIKKGTPDHEDVGIVLRLYELRREPLMRQAREFVASFHPQSFEEIVAVATPSHPQNAFFRQVTSYWEMAATFVNSGALHEELFWTTNGEAIFVFTKFAPFLERVRTELAMPLFLKQVEALIQRRPDGAARVEMVRARLARMSELAKKR